MPRVGLDAESVLQEAVLLADTEGLESLTIAKLALHLGVKAPSLYNHVSSLACVKDDLTTHALLLAVASAQTAMAGVAGPDALQALAHSQRRFANEHPGLWAATNLPVSGWSEASRTAAAAYVSLIAAILRGYGAMDDQVIHAARFIRASLKGFIDLELGGGFGYPQDIEQSFSVLLILMDAGLRSLSNATTPYRVEPPLRARSRKQINPGDKGT